MGCRSIWRCAAAPPAILCWKDSLINRNMVAMAALCWPAFQAFWLRREWGAAALLPVGMIVLVTGGSSESAMIGLLIGLITLSVAMVAPSFTRVVPGHRSWSSPSSGPFRLWNGFTAST